MSSTVHLHSASLHLPDSVFTLPFARTFSTMLFEHSTFRWFAYLNCITYAADLLPSLIQHWKELSILFIRDTPLRRRGCLAAMSLLTFKLFRRQSPGESVFSLTNWMNDDCCRWQHLQWARRSTQLAYKYPIKLISRSYVVWQCVQL